MTSKSVLFGRGLIYLAVLILVLDGIAQIVQPAFMIATMEASQLPLSMTTTLGVLTPLCAAVLAVPRLALLGAILVTGYLGGAIAIHFRLGEVGPPQLVCLLIGIIIWTGIYLSDSRVRALFPVISPARI